MLTYLSDFQVYWGPLRLFGYITFRCLMACITAILIGFWLAPYICRKLQALKMAQIIRQGAEMGELAALHASKKNTPTMGGLIIYTTLVLTTFLWTKLDNIYVQVALIVYSTLTFLGFWDDYMKISKKNPKGLHSRWKWLVQGILAFLCIYLLAGNVQSFDQIVQLWVPFYKYPVIEQMPYWVLFLFFFLVMCGSSNAINLTDGVDGLAIGCTLTVALAYAIIAYAAGHHTVASYLLISYVPGVEELAVVCLGLVGASLVFLWYNSYPAQIFMGDTGSLALGGLIGCIAFMVHQPLTLIIIGGIFVMEALSVILQVASFKLSRQRIFKMAPIHHHFELKGWHENKVVIRFWILSLIFALIGLSTLKIR